MSGTNFKKILAIALGAMVLVAPSAAVAAAPANDDCASAIAVVDGVGVEGSTLEATDSGAATCVVHDTKDVWYTYTAVTNGLVTISTCGSDYDSTLIVYDACGGSIIQCFDDHLLCGSSAVVPCMQVQAGNTYLIRVGGYDYGAGNFTIEVTPCSPSTNDTCSNALPLTKQETVTGSTWSANDEGATACRADDGLDVWYSYTPAANEAIAVSTCGSAYDATLALYDGCGGTLLACDDDGSACPSQDGSPRIPSVNVSAGTPYYIRVAGAGNSGGLFNLTVDDAAAPQVLNITSSATGTVSSDSLFFYVYFDHPVQGFEDGSDLIITGNGVSIDDVIISPSDDAYDVELIGLSGSGDISITVRADSDVRNLADTPLASSFSSPIVLVDREEPIPDLLEITPTQLHVGEIIQIAVSFGEPLASDPLVLVNGNEAQVVAKANYLYTYQVPPTDPAGPATFEIYATDLVGNIFYYTSTSDIEILPGPNVPLAAWPLALVLGGVAITRLRGRRGH